MLYCSINGMKIFEICSIIFFFYQFSCPQQHFFFIDLSTRLVKLPVEGRKDTVELPQQTTTARGTHQLAEKRVQEGVNI